MDFKKLKCKLSRKKYFQYAIQELGKPIILALRRHRKKNISELKCRLIYQVRTRDSCTVS